MNKKNIFTYSILIILLSISFYFNSIKGIISFIASLTIYFSIFYLFHIIWKKIKGAEITKWNKYLLNFLYKVFLLIIILFVILGSFTYYNNEINPANMPEYTISNGEKKVVFQAMSHIGTNEFYSSITSNLIKSKNEGFVYFYEGVKPGKPENLEKFNKAIGIKFDPELYENFSKLYGVGNQDQSKFIGLVNNLDFNIDLNMDQIIEEYEKNPSKNESTSLPMDANKEIVNSLAGLNQRELNVLVYLNQAILNFIIKSDGLKDAITNNFSNKELFNVILGKRNEILAEGIIESEYNKIYTTYGLLHFKGVLELLQENDSNWKIIDFNNYYPIQ